MLARLRSVWFSINASYWFYPALFSLVAFILALALVQLDRSGASAWVEKLPVLEPARPGGASNMLTVLAGSMIGVASTVFSITIAAVAYASGNYGPRLLTNFMEDKGNQLSLATFIGTFVYSITVLRAVRADGETSWFETAAAANAAGFVPQLSLLVAFGLMLISVAVLVYFLHHIPSSIRINAVLEGIGRHLIEMIDKLYPHETGVEDADEPARVDGAQLEADRAGYVRLIAYEDLAATAEKHDLRLNLFIRTGDFLHTGKPILVTDQTEIEEGLAKDLRDAIIVGGSRTPEQDIDFSIDELVEIALRALSPGINDPFTAITAMHWLGAATGKLGQRALLQKPADLSREYELGRVRPLQDGFSHYLQRGFGATRSAVATNRLAACSAFDTLASFGRTIPVDERRRALLRECDLLMEQSRRHMDGPEREEVEKHYRDAREAIIAAGR